MKTIIRVALLLALLTPLPSFAAGGTCPSSVPSGITSCYFIDFVSGLDTNNGTTESTPWQHAPGMTGVVNNVGPGTIDDEAGDKCGSSPCSYPNIGFIFKGGVTWPYSVWPMVMRLQGTSLSAPVYWGVDPTWYSGSSWTRPRLDFGGSANGKQCSTMIMWAPVQYVIWDNFEFTDLYWSHTCNGASNGSISYLNINGAHSGGSYNEIKNNYFHGWTHEAYSPNSTADGCDLISGTTQGTDIGSSFHNNVVNGSDSNNSSGYSCAALWGSPNIVYNNYFAYLANGFIGIASGQLEQWYQNTCTNLEASYDTTQHTQCFETNTDQGTVMYNNLFQHVRVGIVINISTQYGYTSYFWNNVVWDTQDNSNIVDFSYPGGSTGGSLYELNNTIEAGVDGANPSSTLVNCLSGQQACVFKNNHIISSTAQSCGSETNCSASNNVVQSQTLANQQGYAGSSPYPFFPPAAGGGSTTGNGLNLTLATATTPGCNTPGLATLCQDSTVGVGYNSSNNTVIVPGVIPRTTGNPRPTGSSAWGVGAYAGQAPAQPKSLVGTPTTN
jgi:hypothetical protein